MRRVRVLLDANVIVDAQLRDLFLRMAEQELIDVFWSVEILEEVRRALTEGLGLPPSKVDDLLAALSEAFPDAVVMPPEQLVDDLELPDPDDRHVLAAAVHAECDLLLTNNTRDFPDAVTERFDATALSADDGLALVAGWFGARLAEVVDQQIAALRRPAMTREAFIERLAARAPMGAMTIGAALGIETYERMWHDVADAESADGPQGTVRRLLSALEEGRADEVAGIVDTDLSRQLSGVQDPSPGDVLRALRGLLADVWETDGWGFATAKRLHAPGIELVKLVRSGNGPSIAFEPQLVQARLFYLRSDRDGWVLVGLGGPDPALNESS